jgi:antirestriction protein ArdC
VRDIYQALTDRMLDQLEKGRVPWQQPWKSLWPQNLMTKKPYRGVNALVTALSGYESPYWLTFKQALDLGGAVIKGEKATPIIFWKSLEPQEGAEVRKEGSQEPQPERFVVRYSNLFNIEQTEGIEPPKEATKEDFAPIEAAQKIVDSAKLCPIRHGGGEAYWHIFEDYIQMPVPEHFRCPESYYHTLFHEMGHATGHATRLDREASRTPLSMKSPLYAKEELLAELTACFLSNQVGTMKNVMFNNATAYVQHWLKILQNDKHLVVSAASHAQKATAFILGEKEDVTQTQEPVPKVAVEIPTVAFSKEEVVTLTQQGVRP